MPQNKLNALLHFVWATYDRLPLITEDIECPVYRYIEQVCREDKCEVLAVGGMPDHIHLFVSMSHIVSFADLMRHVKGGSSRLITQHLKPGEWFAWQGSYAVFRVAVRDKQKVFHYIENQKQHHAEGSLWPESEQTGQEASSYISE
jgi:REP element-mobilizing transposase RayT